MPTRRSEIVEVSYWRRVFCWHRLLLDQGMYGDAATCVKCGYKFYSNDFVNAVYGLLGKVVR